MPPMSADESLELRDFVAETIKQVIDGVVIAQPYATSKKGSAQQYLAKIRSADMSPRARWSPC
jgi:hypothetical protein